jgi:hypothetical protein
MRVSTYVNFTALGDISHSMRPKHFRSFLLTSGLTKQSSKKLAGVVRQAALKSANDFIFAFGEMVALLCSADNVPAALRLEQLWNELAKSYRFSVCCAYPLSSITHQPDIDAVFQICAEHSFTIPAEGPL